MAGGDDLETTTSPDCGGDGGCGEEEIFSGEGGVFSSLSSPVHHPLRTDRDAARA